MIIAKHDTCCTSALANLSVHRVRPFRCLIMAGTAATVSVLGLIVFGTLASLLGKIGEQHF